MPDRFLRLTRREFLVASVAAAVATACASDGATSSEGPEPTQPDQPVDATTAEPASTPEPTTAPTVEPTRVIDPAANPFTLGVASGDPLDDSVILWTRLDPARVTSDSDIEVAWRVATDADMNDIVASGGATAVAALGHCVHVDVDGLASDRVHHYQFDLDGHVSAIGRTRTFAPPGTMPERLRFAFASCQNWEHGYYAAYRDLVEADDLDAFVFLGDYIYEYPSGGYSDPRGRLTDQAFECKTLDEYRARYALYRSDPLLQAAHAQVPWLITWDDHEVDNDYAANVSEGDDDPAAFLDRRAAAYQAWYEFMPVRLEPPNGPDYDIYRATAHGDLIRFHVLDSRQYRSDQQRGEPFLATLGDAVQERDDAVQFAPGHTMLGERQHDWLVGSVAGSGAVWDVLAQQVFMFGGNASPGADPPVVVVDTWDGYAGERERLLSAIGAGAPDGADNLVVLTGDFHSAAVGVLRADPFDLTQPIVGVELMAPSISSAFFDDNATTAGLVDLALSTNPQLRFFDTRSGYTLCEVTPERLLVTYRAVADIFDERSPVDTIATWSVTAGVAEIEPAG